MKIDCHFHPNFNFLKTSFIKKRSLKIFKQFAKHKIDAVIVTEHVFKKPYQSFKKLKSFQPTNSKTLLIPGVEAVTKEGIDVIVFSASEYVYTKKEIMTTWCLSLKDLLKQVSEDKKLHAIIPHPFLPNSQGLFSSIGYKDAKKILNNISLFEQYNDCFTTLIELLSKTKLNIVFPNLFNNLKKVQNSPTPVSTNYQITGGSDAHHPFNIGSHLKLHCPKPTDINQAIKNLLSPIDREFVFIKSQAPILKDLILNAITASSELCLLKFKKSHIDLKTTYHEQCQSLHQGRRELGKINTQI